jgi:hypothetical protein
MVTNVGKVDRIVRIILGLALLAVVLLGQGPLRWLGLIGIVPLATAFMGWCPAYSLFGMSTCDTKTT